MVDSIEYNNIISTENLLVAWVKFLKNKKNKKDVQDFQTYLMDNILDLHFVLKTKTYVHGPYKPININDPKPRNIHKPLVRDRLLHHAVYQALYSFFDIKFIHDSYSCRSGKGTHKALNRFRDFGRKVSKNNTETCWILKCDIKKFFASVNHTILLNILDNHIQDKNIIWLLERVIMSFNSGKENTGLPLGNLTSQLLVNIYMNKFDQWVKHRMKTKYYIRYADDFVILNQDRDYLLELTPKIADFLDENLKLSLHPNKVFVRTLFSGVDFLGWVHFPNFRVLRTVTKKRMMRRIEETQGKEETAQSYLGMLRWGNGYKLRKKIADNYFELV